MVTARACALLTTLVVALTSVSWAETVSPAKAFLLSLAVPGLGQAYAGSHRSAWIFGGVETTSWLVWVGMNGFERSYRDDYMSQARGVAGASVDGKPDRYFADLGFYDSRRDHNRWELTSGQTPVSLYDSSDDWEWPSALDRQAYRDARNSSKTWERNAGWMLTGIALHHFASAVHAAKTAKQANSSATSAAKFDWIVGHDGGWASLEWRF